MHILERRIRLVSEYIDVISRQCHPQQEEDIHAHSILYDLSLRQGAAEDRKFPSPPAETLLLYYIAGTIIK